MKLNKFGKKACLEFGTKQFHANHWVKESAPGVWTPGAIFCRHAPRYLPRLKNFEFVSRMRPSTFVRSFLIPHLTSWVFNHIMGKNSLGSQWEQQSYPPTWRQKIYTKGGRNISLLCNRSWPCHSGSFRHIGCVTIKSNRRHKRSSGWLLCHKLRFQIEIPGQQHDIAHTQRYIIPIRITC